jgi:hypothetical protein
MSKNKPGISEDNYDDDSPLVCSVIKKYTEKKRYVSVKNISIEIDIDGRIYKLIRLNDDQFYVLNKNSIPIIDDYIHLMLLYSVDEIIYSSTPKMYITLKSLFGEHGDDYDDWSGTFSFPFLIHFREGEEEFEYLMNIYDIKSSIDFKIAKLIEDEDERFEKGIHHKPFEEFPREKINYVINYFVGFLTRYFESCLNNQYDEFFFKIVRSDLILYGYKDGRYFDDEYETEEKFDAAIQKLRKKESSNVQAVTE